MTPEAALDKQWEDIRGLEDEVLRLQALERRLATAVERSRP